MTATLPAPGILSDELLASMEDAARQARADVRDPDARREARRQMDAIREQIRRREGVLDLGVPAIRQFPGPLMLRVLDSSVAFKWVVPEIDTDKALRLQDDATAGTVELISPHVFPTELAHALTRAERQGRLAFSEAARCWQAAMGDAPRLFDALPLTPRAIDISSKHRVGVYDCIYIALAEAESCEFVTADDKLVNNLQQYFPFIIALSSLP